MPKLLQAALLCIAVSATSVALAESGPGGTAKDTMWQSPQSGELRASRLIGTSVKNAAGETIGDINEVVIGKDGKVAAVVLGVGGFLGMGEHEVAVRLDSLRLIQGADQETTATLNATKEALKSAPEWKWSADDRMSPAGSGTKPPR